MTVIERIIGDASQAERLINSAVADGRISRVAGNRLRELACDHIFAATVFNLSKAKDANGGTDHGQVDAEGARAHETKRD